jgi:hypothetical protein
MVRKFCEHTSEADTSHPDLHFLVKILQTMQNHKLFTPCLEVGTRRCQLAVQINITECHSRQKQFRIRRAARSPSSRVDPS